MDLWDGMRVHADGLNFPEGPVVAPDGSLLVVEIGAGVITRVLPDGRKEKAAEPGGGPNGGAAGPDGALWICNNGGFRREQPGRIERADLATGKVEIVATHAATHAGKEPLRAPNDLAFDNTGGLWFTDSGHVSRKRERAAVAGGIYYIPAGSDEPEEVLFPVDTPNGIGLSADNEWLYWSETVRRRIVRRRLAAPGVLAPSTGDDLGTLSKGDAPDPDVLLASLPGRRWLDSLAVDGEGWVNVGTLGDAGLTCVSPAGEIVHHPLPPSDPERFVTNLCFGGPDLRTAYVTFSLTGRVVEIPWPREGLRAPWPLNT